MEAGKKKQQKRETETGEEKEQKQILTYYHDLHDATVSVLNSPTCHGTKDGPAGAEIKS
jgi:hypothetical protein